MGDDLLRRRFCAETACQPRWVAFATRHNSPIFVLSQHSHGNSDLATPLDRRRFPQSMQNTSEPTAAMATASVCGWRAFFVAEELPHWKVLRQPFGAGGHWAPGPLETGPGTQRDWLRPGVGGPTHGPPPFPPCEAVCEEKGSSINVRSYPGKNTTTRRRLISRARPYRRQHSSRLDGCDLVPSHCHSLALRVRTRAALRRTLPPSSSSCAESPTMTCDRR